MYDIENGVCSLPTEMSWFFLMSEASLRKENRQHFSETIERTRQVMKSHEVVSFTFFHQLSAHAFHWNSADWNRVIWRIPNLSLNGKRPSAFGSFLCMYHCKGTVIVLWCFVLLIAFWMMKPLELNMAIILCQEWTQQAVINTTFCRTLYHIRLGRFCIM